jgi:hypothetical protein
MLFEGLEANDLKDTVKNVISINQYESKIDDDEVVVVAFILDYKEPAEDLNRFIQKSTAQLLDTEVSATITKEGSYLVFVEFYDNKDFPQELSEVLKEVSQLTGIKKWYYSYYKDKTRYFTIDNLKKSIEIYRKNKLEK